MATHKDLESIIYCSRCGDKLIEDIVKDINYKFLWFGGTEKDKVQYRFDSYTGREQSRTHIRKHCKNAYKTNKDYRDYGTEGFYSYHIDDFYWTEWNYEGRA